MVDGAVTSQKSWVELRVHGVSGTPPEDLLAWPHVMQVDGDERSRFFRAVDSAGNVQPAPDGHAVEGFHWGRYTSGSWIKAFWLALLPFGLVNASAFMLPAPHDASGTWIRFARAFRLVALAALRFIAILLTLLLSFGTSFTLIVVVGKWAPRRSSVPDWLIPAVPSLVIFFSGLFVLLLGGVTLVVRLFGRRSGEPEPARAAAEEGTALTPFASHRFYVGDTDTLTLRGLHVAAGLAVPAYMGLSSSKNGTTAAALLLIVAVVVTVFLGDPEKAATTGFKEERNQHVVRWHGLARGLAVIAVLGGVVLIMWASVLAYGKKQQVALDALDRFVQPDSSTLQADLLLYAGALGLAFLALAVGGLSWVTRHERAADGPAASFRPYSKGMTTIPIAAMALFLGVGYSAAVVIGVASLLNGRRTTLGLLPVLDRVTYAWGLSILPVIVIVILLLIRRTTSRQGMGEHALIGYPPEKKPEPEQLKAWRLKLGSAVWFARVKNGFEKILWTLVAVGSVLSVAIALDDSWGTKRPDNLGVLGYLSGNVEKHHGIATAFTQLGALVLIGLMSALVFLARGAFRDASLRRSVNIVWDVVAFWPHAVHPFIPTPYSLRTVGDLAERVRRYAHDPDVEGRAVVVCGHSQGSLVSFAALNLMSDEECARLGFLTFGSQLRLIFARAFPMYVNYDAINRLYERLGGAWVNLYRDTDPLAGPVLSWRHSDDDKGATSGHFPIPDAGERPDEIVGKYRTRRSGDDWRLVDPVPRVEELQPAPVNALHGHSNYWTNPEWGTALDAVRTRGITS